jgi:hypothetical protein
VLWQTTAGIPDGLARDDFPCARNTRYTPQGSSEDRILAAKLAMGWVISAPRIRPMRLFRIAKPFDDPDYVFELKHDVFRALA